MDARRAIEAAQGMLAEMRRIPTMPCLEDVHAALLQFVASEEAAMSAGLEGVTSGKPGLIATAAHRSQESTVYLGRATELLRRAAC